MEIVKTKDDFYTSVERAFDEIDPKWRDYKGLVIVGSHAPTLIDEKIAKIKEAREKGIPFLGICFGMQLAVIEFARNVLKEEDASSEEFGHIFNCYITKLPHLRVGIKKVESAYAESVESHWHNFAVNKDLVGKLIDGGMSVTEWGEDGIVERIQLKGTSYFDAVQYHPEYQSSEERPHRVLHNFLIACKNQTQK